MPAVIAPTQTDLLTAIRAFVLSLVDCEVVRGLQNGVPMPASPFVVLTPGGLHIYRTTIDVYDGGAMTRTMHPGDLFTVQIDCYGVGSQDRAATIAGVFRSNYPDGFGIAAGYTSDPRQLSFVNDQQQYEERWSLDVTCGYNPSIAVPQDFFTAIEVDLLSVDVEYPPNGS